MHAALRPLISRALLAVALMLSFPLASHGNECRDLFQPEQVSPERIVTLKSYVENYADLIPAVKDMIEIGLERFQGRKANGKCYQAVKGLLVDSGLTRRSIDGTFASSAHTKDFLAKRGFINLLERAPFSTEIKGALDPNIPVGAVLVYEGTNGVDRGIREIGKGIGHIEIKCGANCYIFDTVNQYPGGGQFSQIKQPGIMEGGSGYWRRRLIGVYVLDFFALF